MMHDMMGSGMMWGIGLLWLLLLFGIVFGVAALVKYLIGRR